ncbi:MAG: 2'-5' RNA ligase family protein [Bacteroidetes bacterium]|nr:2'-5' RNA ligase family protein [Bacteroidota bacterium]
MRLYVAAYPELLVSDYELIQDYRRKYDRIFNLIEPHFTFVFAVTDFTIEDFATEVKKQFNETAPIHFSLRCATINKDDFSDMYFAFLVPDEGNSRMIKLHDKLYADKLAHHHRMDIDYIPHILFAGSTDKILIKKLVDEWNEKNIVINGTIKAIDILKHIDGQITTVEKIPLQ